MGLISELFNDLPMFLLRIPVILLALSVHEAAHGFMADKLGDPTAKLTGRLSLNPLRHLDPVGALALLFLGFGWAKPVMVIARNFKHPKRDMALTAAAGPVSNLLLGWLGILFSRLFLFFVGLVPSLPEEGSFGLQVLIYTYQFLTLFASLNLSLAVFNLLPFPPLDGSRIFLQFLPAKWYFGIMKYEQYIQIALILLLWLGVLTPVLSFLVTNLWEGMEWTVSFIPV